jgi:hypothetical protein
MDVVGLVVLMFAILKELYFIRILIGQSKKMVYKTSELQNWEK